MYCVLISSVLMPNAFAASTMALILFVTSLVASCLLSLVTETPAENVAIWFFCLLIACPVTVTVLAGWVAMMPQFTFFQGTKKQIRVRRMIILIIHTPCISFSFIDTPSFYKDTYIVSLPEERVLRVFPNL